jgi:superfamily II DNA or RNA helicase
MKQIVLHPYQGKLYTDIHASWDAGNRNVLAVSGTGSGKSVLTSEIILTGYNKGLRQVVGAHRNELVTQMSSHIARRGIPHRIIGSNSTIAEAQAAHREEFGQSFVNPSAPTAVIGVDTLMARKDDLHDWARQVHRWVMDEAHHTIGNDRVERNKWGKAVQMFSNAYGLGVTATPSRADGQGLGADYDGVFHDMVQGPSMRWLIEHGFLSDYEIVCPTSDLARNIENEKVSKDGDWSHQTMRKASKKSKIVGDVVKEYGKYAYGRRAIVFATDVETAAEMAEQFNAWGVRAVSLNGNSNPLYRRQSLRQFASGEIQVLVNVDLFDEGFDCPACDVVIMARPTASLGKYLQMIGRALRYVYDKVALIIDHVSNVVRHGLPDKVRAWSLARKDKRAKQAKDPNDIELTTCYSCLKPYEKFRTVCPYCSAEKPLPEPRSRSVEMVEGDLILLDRAALEKMRKATEIENAGSVADRVSRAAGPIAGKSAANRQMEKIVAHRELSETVAQWAAIQRQKGYSDRELYKQFYLTTGVDVLSALDGKKTRQEFEDLTNVVRGWYS